MSNIVDRIQICQAGSAFAPGINVGDLVIYCADGRKIVVTVEYHMATRPVIYVRPWSYILHRYVLVAGPNKRGILLGLLLSISRKSHHAAAAATRERGQHHCYGCGKKGHYI